MSKVKDISSEALSDKCTQLHNGITYSESKAIRVVDSNNEFEVLSAIVKLKSTPIDTLKVIQI